MFDLDLDLVTDFTVALLVHYSFDLGGQTARELINHWLTDYPASWIYQGVIEALYQGRYKAVSVEQILAYWQRRGQAMHHYSYEFERLVCNGFPPPALGGNVTSSNQNNSRMSAIRGFSQLKQVKAPAEPTGQLTSISGEYSPLPRPIQQFTPPHDNSEFYTKLKALSQSNQQTRDPVQRQEQRYELHQDDPEP